MAKDNKKSQRFFFGFVLGKKMRVGLKGMFCIHPRSFVSQLFLYTQQNTQHTQNTHDLPFDTEAKIIRISFKSCNVIIR